MSVIPKESAYCKYVNYLTDILYFRKQKVLVFIPTIWSNFSASLCETINYLKKK